MPSFLTSRRGLTSHSLERTCEVARFETAPTGFVLRLS